MKVILQRDVKGLGKAGQVVEAADGYARNFLIPRGLAAPASDGNLKQLRQQQRLQDRRAAQELKAAQSAAQALTGKTLVVKARTGEGGRLYGSVTNGDIAAAVKQQYGLKIDRRKIELDEPLRQLGRFQVPVRLHPEITVEIDIEIAPE